MDSNDVSIYGLIPARGGSKGIPRKNLATLNGKPLIEWTVEAAFRSTYLDRVILSSEDPEIIAVAESLGCEVPFRRPEGLADDETPGYAVVEHALVELPDCDLLVLLQPTSPLRTSVDIDAAIKKCINQGAPACVTVSPVKKPPHWMYSIGPDGQLEKFIQLGEGKVQRRQEAPNLVALNGAVYVGWRRFLTKADSFIGPGTVAHVMPDHRSVDIDTEADLEVASVLLDRLNGRGEHDGGVG